MNDYLLRLYRERRALNGDKLGRPAQAAWASARSFVHFRERLAASVAADKRRSKAARKGWKTRRAAAAS